MAKKYIIKRIFLLGLLVSFKLGLVYDQAYAYTRLPLIKNTIELSDRSSALLLGVNTLSFIKNDEYFGPMVQGHTLVGHHLHPYLAYAPHEHVQCKTGVFMRRDWAAVQFFAHYYPTLSIQYQNQGFSLLMGTMANQSGHGLIEPLYNPELFLSRGPESGLQLQYRGSKTALDLWLAWLTLLDKQANKPEELCASMHLKQRLINQPHYQLSLPIQVRLYHLGGQGIATPDYSLWMGAIGGRLKLLLDEHAWLKSISFKNYFVFSRYIKKVARPFQAGQALYHQIKFKTTWLAIATSYWQGNGFSADHIGSPLYQSIALVDQKVTHQEKFRRLFFVDLNYKYQLTEQMMLSLHLAPYYDFKNNLLEHSEGLYISYHPRFKLADIQQANNYF